MKVKEINKAYLMDCIEGMKQLPDKSIDMILCDLPYGVTQNKWDCVIPFDELWAAYKRIIKDNGAIVLTAQTPFDKVLGASNIEWLRYEWIWDKVAVTGFLNAKKMPLKQHETILVFYKNLPPYNPQMVPGKPYNKGKRLGQSENYGKFKEIVSENITGERYPKSILTFSNANKRNRIHPTQKPVDLFEYLIKTYTNEGDLVLDNCLGSGTTAIAAINTNRNWLGFENDATYFTLLEERIYNHIHKS